LANPTTLTSVLTPTPAATLFDQAILTEENKELRAKLSALQDTVTTMALAQADMQRNFAHLFSTLNTVDWKLTKEQAALVEAAGGATSNFNVSQG
jgi:sensor histidine kinase YesM